jgi:hypothetical protein
MELPTFTHPHLPAALFDDTHYTWMGYRRANTIRGVVNLLQVKGHVWPCILIKTYHLPSAFYSSSFHCASESPMHKSRAAECLFGIGLHHSRRLPSQSRVHELTDQDEDVRIILSAREDNQYTLDNRPYSPRSSQSFANFKLVFADNRLTQHSVNGDMIRLRIIPHSLLPGVHLLSLDKTSQAL